MCADITLDPLSVEAQLSAYGESRPAVIKLAKALQDVGLPEASLAAGRASELFLNPAVAEGLQMVLDGWTRLDVMSDRLTGFQSDTLFKALHHVSQQVSAKIKEK